VASLSNPASRCPDLRVTDEEEAAVVVFLVNVVGVPSKTSLRTSSGSTDLDNAALSCIPKLRFQPATRIGDSAAFDSWQQLGMKWARPSQHGGVAVGTSTSAAPPPAGTTPAAAGQTAAATGVALAATAAPNLQPGAVQLRVCANDKGQLTQDPSIVKSSGNAEIDAAAVRIATAASGSYRPPAQLNGKALSGCAELAVKFETN
jgi:TonB family protein